MSANEVHTNTEIAPVVPVHLGIILDGNRRWAREQNLPTFKGHQKGYENLVTIAEAALARGVRYLTAFVFSTENWSRSADEVKYLMDLFLWVAEKDWKRLHDKNTRLRFIGSQDQLPAKLVAAIRKVEDITRDNTGGDLVLCLNYGGQQEIVQATQAIMAAGLKPEELTKDVFSQYLYAPDVPPVDLVIRTSGEQRLSNFMLWRIAYSEIYFGAVTHWPAFTVGDLDAALDDYARRQRRFGK